MASAIFPTICDTKIISTNSELNQHVVKLNIRSKSEWTIWLDKFGKLNFLTYRVLRTRKLLGDRVIYKAWYRCHHNTHPLSTVKNPSKKHSGCKNVLKVTIKGVPEFTRSKDAFLSTHPTTVEIQNVHNHKIRDAEALKFRDPTNEVIGKFLELFKNGHSPSQALELYKKQLINEYGNSASYAMALADRAICPELQWVFYQYYKAFGKEHRSSNCKNLQIDKTIFFDITQSCQEDSVESMFNETPTVFGSDLTDEQQLNSKQMDTIKENLHFVVEAIMKKSELNPEAFCLASEQYKKSFQSLNSESAILSALYSFGQISVTHRSTTIPVSIADGHF